MNNLLKNIKTFALLTRSYSLPISVMSWLIPFVYALFKGGNVIYGIMALLGIIILHLASNLFDDIVDYSRELIDIKKGLKSDFNFQKGKCVCILNNQISFKKAVLIDLILFIIVLFIAAGFLYLTGFKLLYVIIPAAVLCLLYPVLGSVGFGEIIIALIFSPLLYSGVYFVMTGGFSYEILILSISTGLLTVAVLINHSLLDYKYDKKNRKITLCRLCSSEKNSLTALCLIIVFSYLNLIFWILKGELSIFYLLPFLTMPFFIKLVKEMKKYIKSDKVPDNSELFLKKFMLAQNLQLYFIIVLCLSVIISYWFKV